ncbi:aminotransferase class V-fold PLP-dependent enzyme [Fodinibius sp. Rm-B-1B1-1]|uniref:aminotransferase class V-fold PLP-dependent enzyme n=1 Tax=Fodinibius alkaliphilus TaxID=3140241 RepID=UPI00315A18A2
MDCQKHLFSLPNDHHYINCSYLSPLLKSVEDAGIEGIKSNNRPWKTKPNHFFEDSATLRSLFAQLVHAPKANDVAIMPAVSYGLATVAKNINPDKGNTIIIAGEQFPSNVYAWRRFCKEHNCQIKTVDAPGEFKNRGQRWNERIIDAIDSDTLLVALGNVHWTDGTWFDLKTIGEKARSNNAYFVIDGTQSVGALPINVQEIQADALICAGYKWLMGPYAMTLGYFGPRLQDGIPLEEGWIVRKNSEDFSGLVDYEDGYQPGAQRFDVGERSNFVLVPMMIEALKQILKWKPKNIQAYCKHLTANLEKGLPDHGYQIEDSEWRAGHMFGIRLPTSVSLQKLQQQLDEHNIHVSVRGSAVRISPNVYNDKTDISMLFDVLKEVADNT